MSRARVALTSTAEAAVTLAPLAERSGLEPIVLPCIEYVVADSGILATARERAAHADWLVLTSSRAVTALWPHGGMPGVAVAAVGPGTAEAVRVAGGVPSLVGDGGAAELYDLLSGHVSGRTVFFPHAASADLAGLDALESSGAVVQSLAVYEVRPISPAVEPVAGVVFGSPTAVRGWFSSRSVDGLTVGAIGATTAAALSERGVPSVLVPPQPSFQLLIELIAADLRDRSIA